MRKKSVWNDSVTSVPKTALKLGKWARRSGIFYVWSTKCEVDYSAVRVKHSKVVLTGGIYTVGDRLLGYLPYTGYLHTGGQYTNVLHCRRNTYVVD